MFIEFEKFKSCTQIVTKKVILTNIMFIFDLIFLVASNRKIL